MCLIYFKRDIYQISQENHLNHLLIVDYLNNLEQKELCTEVF